MVFKYLSKALDNSKNKISSKRTLAEQIEHTLTEYSHKTAFTCGNDRMTFSELNDQSYSIAAYVTNILGLSKRNRAAVMLPNVLEFPTITFGLQRAGIVQVNINPLYTKNELLHQLNDADVETIFIHEMALPTLNEIIKGTSIRNTVIISSSTTKIHSLRSTSDRTSRQQYSFPSIILEGRNLNFSPPPIRPDDIAFLQYTGGTSGVAKGAMLTQNNIASNILQFRHFTAGHLNPGNETVITAIPMYHIFALTVNTLAMATLGANNILIPNPRDMNDFVEQWQKHPVSFATGVNTLFAGLLSSSDFQRTDFNTLKLTIGGGAPVQKAVSERWKKVTGNHLKEGYGLSETSPVLTVTPLDENEFTSSIGEALPKTLISIRDDNEIEVEDGTEGELCAKGPQVMKGYWKKTQETQACMTQDGFFKTGDVAVVGNDGRLRIVDRKKDLIIVSGFNVYPNEVEAEIANLEGVLESACVGYSSPKTGEGVALYIVKSDPNLSIDDVIEHCRAGLAKYKIPSKIEFLDELPKSTVGKILRRELRTILNK